MELFDYIWLLVIPAIIIAFLISHSRDKTKLSGLKRNLLDKGFIIDEELYIFDENLKGEKLTFLIDRNNKKWGIALYNENDCRTYDYSYISDYTVTIQMRGDGIHTGENQIVKASEAINSNYPDGILNKLNIKADNCLFVSMDLKLTDRTKQLLLFDYQKIVTEHKGNFTKKTAILWTQWSTEFEKRLFEIVKDNLSNTKAVQ